MKVVMSTEVLDCRGQKAHDLVEQRTRNAGQPLFGDLNASTSVVTAPAAQHGMGSRLHPLLAATRQHLNVDLAAVAEIRPDRVSLVAADGNVKLLAEAIASPGDLLTRGADPHGRAYLLPRNEARAITSSSGWSLVQPVPRTSGSPFALIVGGRRGTVNLNAELTRYLGALASVIGTHLGVPDEGKAHAKRTARIAAVIDDGGPAMVGQPIVRLRNGKTVGFEALARFSGHTGSTPLSWFARAYDVGLAMDLEIAALGRAMSHLGALPPGTFMAVNLSPRCALGGSLDRVFAGVPLDRVVLEITEHAPVDSYRLLKRSLLRFRAAGLQVAIDDAGAGLASMQHILKLKPDTIKLDGSWVADVEVDAPRRALISAMVSFARDANVRVIGEAIETAAQAATLLELGVELGQGYLFGRPEPFRATAPAA